MIFAERCHRGIHLPKSRRACQIRMQPLPGWLRPCATTSCLVTKTSWPTLTACGKEQRSIDPDR